MITCSTEAYKPELKKLWKICFDDNDEFIRFYFDKIYQNQNALVFIDTANHSPVAFLQIIPYQIKIGKNIYEAGYISGAMTHPEHRKKGYMQQLLETAFTEMKKRNYTFTFLIPQENWLFDFYTKSGYIKAFPRAVTNLDLTTEDETNYRNPKIYSNLNETPIEKLYHFYDKILTQKTNVVLKTQTQFAFMLEDLFIDEGEVFYVENEGIAFVAPSENNVMIKEMFYTNEHAKQVILNAIKNFFGVYKPIFITHSAGENSHCHGMIKILIPSNFQEKTVEDIYMNMMLD